MLEQGSQTIEGHEEANFTDDHRSEKCVILRGFLYAHKVMETSKNNISLVILAVADEWRLRMFSWSLAEHI